MTSFLRVALGGIILVNLKRILSIITLIRKNPEIPRRICLIQPMTKVGSTVPTTWWNPGLYWTWNERETLYRDVKAEIILVIPLLWGPPAIYTSSPELLTEVIGFQSTFFKPPIAILGINRFGPNVVASSGQQWRRHRKITAPAFDNKLYTFVWDEVIRLYGLLREHEGWDDKQTVNIKSINDHTTTFALGAISAAGFGEPLTTWHSEEMDVGQDVPLRDAIAEVTKLIVPWAMLPPWAFKYPSNEVKRVQYIFNRFQSLSEKKISMHKSEIMDGDSGAIGGSRDLFTRLIQANQANMVDGGSASLEDEEVLGNIFAFLFAGHETTASSMAITLALFALHPEEQTRAYEAVKKATEDEQERSLSWCYLS